jgi:hypothetical protein
MPIKNGVGYSETTIDKQVDFIKIMKMLCRIWKGTTRYNYINNEIYYFDLNGGFGYDLDCPIIGSPIIAAKSLKDSCLPHKGFVCEIEYENILSLKDTLLPYDNFTVVQGNNQYALIEHLPSDGLSNGLFYADNNGFPETELSFLEYACQQRVCQRMDILLSFGATTIKRLTNRYPNKHFELQENISRLNKKKWFIRELMNSKQKWTFVLGTNWANFPAPQNYFHCISSPKGQDVLSFFYDKPKSGVMEQKRFL